MEWFSQKGGLDCKGCKEEIYFSDADTKAYFCITLGIQVHEALEPLIIHICVDKAN